MIAYLRGTVLSKSGSHVILEAHQVGYLVGVPLYVLSSIELGQDIELFIHTHMSENALTLAGFMTKDDLELFEQLISISGIGPKSALQCLQQGGAILRKAIQGEDLLALTQIPGVGKKTAERIILELKGKVFAVNGDAESPKVAPDDDALQALISLGFSAYEAKQRLARIDASVTDVQKRITLALQG